MKSGILFEEELCEMDDELLQEIAAIIESHDDINWPVVEEVFRVLREYGVSTEGEILEVLTTVAQEGWVDEKKSSELLVMIYSPLSMNFPTYPAKQRRTYESRPRIRINKYGELL